MYNCVMRISPEIAHEMLELYWEKCKQRKPNRDVVNMYARDMKSGKWLMTHQGIAINENNELVDGLHRLLAIVESGTTIESFVTFGLKENSIDYIDTGRRRSVSQILSMLGKKNCKALSACANQVYILCARYIGVSYPKSRVGLTVFNAAIESYGDEIEYLISRRTKFAFINNAPVYGALAFAMKVYPDTIKEFYNELVAGEMLSNGDPTYTLRRWLSLFPMARGTHGDPINKTNAVLLAAMRYVNGEKIHLIKNCDKGYLFFLARQLPVVQKMLLQCGHNIDLTENNTAIDNEAKLC